MSCQVAGGRGLKKLNSRAGRRRTWCHATGPVPLVRAIIPALTQRMCRGCVCVVDDGARGRGPLVPPSPPRAASPLAAPLSPPVPPPTNFAILARPSLAFSPAIPFLLFHPATNPYIDFTAFLCRPRPPPPPCPRARRGCAPARPWRQRGKCGTPASVPAASLLAGAPSPVLPAAGIAVSPPLPLQRPQPPLVAAVVGGR